MDRTTAHSAANAATASVASTHTRRMPCSAPGAARSTRPGTTTSPRLAPADVTVAVMRGGSLHACSSTSPRVTSPLPPTSDGCHAERRILVRMRVLVVEDHATLAGRIAQGLRQAGLAVDAVYDGAAAVEAAAQTAYDVIVLDRDLPVVHGDH